MENNTENKTQDDAPRFRIEVETAYIEEQSIPENDHYVFTYTVTIHNSGKVGARLLGRHWVITDANGQVQEVLGEGVVGEKPFLRPGEDFRYTSGTALKTPVGSMQGSYQMRSELGEHFETPIAPFTLATPRALH